MPFIRFEQVSPTSQGAREMLSILERFCTNYLPTDRTSVSDKGRAATVGWNDGTAKEQWKTATSVFFGHSRISWMPRDGGTFRAWMMAPSLFGLLRVAAPCVSRCHWLCFTHHQTATAAAALPHLSAFSDRVSQAHCFSPLSVPNAHFLLPCAGGCRWTKRRGKNTLSDGRFGRTFM